MNSYEARYFTQSFYGQKNPPMNFALKAKKLELFIFKFPKKSKHAAPLQQLNCISRQASFQLIAVAQSDRIRPKSLNLATF